MTPHEPTPAAGNGPSIDPATERARDFEAQVIAQAVQDPALRARLLADPKAVFAERGFNVPADVKIQALQETADHCYLVLPALVERRVGAGLSDADLEPVAGGAVSQDTKWTGCASGQSGCFATAAYAHCFWGSGVPVPGSYARLLRCGQASPPHRA